MPPSNQEAKIPESLLIDELRDNILTNIPKPIRIDMVLVKDSNPPVWSMTRYYP